MGRRSVSGGVTPKGDRIQFDFWLDGIRYRPTIKMVPTQANLKYARRRQEDINRRITLGTFNFSEEFPDYRFLHQVSPENARPDFNAIADQFEQSIGGSPWATRESYRKILKAFWRPKLGNTVFIDITHAELSSIVGGHPWSSNKTRNNVLSVMKRVFDFGYADIESKRNPAEKLKSLKVQRQPPDPYTLAEAEALLSGMEYHFGHSDAHYFEFGFFAGLRPSEAIALTWPDVGRDSVRIDKARVMARDKDSTKTSIVRDVELNPRALDVLRRQKDHTFLAGKQVFGPYHDLQVPWKRWVYVHKKLDIRYREPYQVRHTSVSWNLMIGKNLLWVAAQHGHSPAVMLKVYAKWLKGATPEDVLAIEAAMSSAKSSAKNGGFQGTRGDIAL